MELQRPTRLTICDEGRCGHRRAAAAVEDLADLAAALEPLEPDARAIVLDVAVQLAGRVRAGQGQHGRLNLNTDRRDFAAEASAELLDGAFYLACGRLRRSRAALATIQHPGPPRPWPGAGCKRVDLSQSDPGIPSYPAGP